MMRVRNIVMSTPIPLIGSILVILATVAHSVAETADERLLRSLAGADKANTNKVRALLKKGARPDVPDNAGRAALHGAAAIDAVDTVRVLLKAGVDKNRQDKDGRTALHGAAAVGAAETAGVLLKAGADPNLKDRDGNTPLHLAADAPALSRSPGGAVATVRRLLSAGANADRTNKNRETPLHVAAGSHGSPGMIAVLLKGKANPKIKNRDGLTALQLFVRAGPDEGDTAAMLIDAGASPNDKYPSGDAPLHVTIRAGGSRGKFEVADALLAGGADPCIRDAKGYIPYQIAREGGVIHQALSRAGGYERACDKKGRRVPGRADEALEAAIREAEREMQAAGARLEAARKRMQALSESYKNLKMRIFPMLGSEAQYIKLRELDIACERRGGTAEVCQRKQKEFLRRHSQDFAPRARALRSEIKQAEGDYSRASDRYFALQERRSGLRRNSR